jgi:hypothetical protein
MGAQQSAGDGPLDPELLFGKGSYLNDGGDGPLDATKVFGCRSDQEMFDGKELQRYTSMSKEQFRNEALQRISSLSDMKDTIPAILHSANAGAVDEEFASQHHINVQIELTRYNMKVLDDKSKALVVCIPYITLTELTWDHAESRIRIAFKPLDAGTCRISMNN